MRVHYVSFFGENDPAEQPLKDYLSDLQNEADTDLVISEIKDVTNWKPAVQSLNFDKLDVLIVGCHGHKSLTGFCIANEPVRWHELASALKDSLPTSCSFIFYSCNGGYPEIAHVFYGSGGPDFLFGPYIHVDSDAMKYAVLQIVDWKRRGSSVVSQRYANKVVQVSEGWNLLLRSMRRDGSCCCSSGRSVRFWRSGV